MEPFLSSANVWLIFILLFFSVFSTCQLYELTMLKNVRKRSNWNECEIARQWRMREEVNGTHNALSISANTHAQAHVVVALEWRTSKWCSMPIYSQWPFAHIPCISPNKCVQKMRKTNGKKRINSYFCVCVKFLEKHSKQRNKEFTLRGRSVCRERNASIKMTENSQTHTHTCIGVQTNQ